MAVTFGMGIIYILQRENILFSVLVHFLIKRHYAHTSNDLKVQSNEYNTIKNFIYAHAKRKTMLYFQKNSVLVPLNSLLYLCICMYLFITVFGPKNVFLLFILKT